MSDLKPQAETEIGKPRILEAAMTYLLTIQFLTPGPTVENNAVIQEKVNAFKANAANQGFDPEAIVCRTKWASSTRVNLEMDVPEFLKLKEAKCTS